MKNLRQALTELAIIDSALGLLGVVIILTAALAMQFVYYEEPCPLCLLQRVGFINIGLSLLMNLKYGNRVSHWALVILSAAAGIAVSMRQILLHINEPIGFGSPVFGLHMYTWCFIGFSLAIVGSAIMLIIYPEKIKN